MQNTTCSTCHTDNEDGTWTGLAAISVPDMDVDNLALVAEDTEASLAQYIADEMPDGSAGNCVDDCATDIAAYMWSYRTDTATMVIPLATGWRVNPDTITFSAEETGVTYAPTANEDQLVYDLVSPINLNNAQIVFTFEADADFIASGAALQPIVQEKDGWNGHWGCWIDSQALSAGTYTCQVPETGWDIQHAVGVQFGFQIPGADNSAAPAGSVTITGVTILLAE